jgi:hypothetical protein
MRMHCKCSNTFWADFSHQNFHSCFSVTIQHFVLGFNDKECSPAFLLRIVHSQVAQFWLGRFSMFWQFAIGIAKGSKAKRLLRLRCFCLQNAYSLFQMKGQNFNYYSEKSTFKTLIAMDPAFQFKQSDMESFRNKIATLIGNLLKTYLMSDEIKCTK